MQAISQSAFAFLPGVGTQELLIILFIILLLFGAKKLPELARGLGKSMREFKKATSDIEEDFRNAMDEEPKTAKPKAEGDRVEKKKAVKTVTKTEKAAPTPKEA